MYNISSADYDIVSILDNHDSVKIVTGPFSGTIVTYNNVLLTEPTNGKESAKLSFHYVINESFLDEDELESPGFKQYLGELLEYIMWSSIEDDNYKVGTINASNTNSKEPSRK